MKNVKKSKSAGKVLDLQIDHYPPSWELTPKEIVAALDRHIVGQTGAKRAVAIAFRNRWRRAQLNEELREESKPDNILFIGPTGSGKTEISRRLATLVGAPFIKVEATKFTEVGYVGRDVESIVRDLMDVAIKQIREQEKRRLKNHVFDIAVERVLDALLPKDQEASDANTRELFRKKLLEGALDDKQIEVEIVHSNVGVEIMAPPGMEEMTSQLQDLFSNLSSGRKKKKKMKVKDALKQLTEDETASILNEDEIRKIARDNVEQNGVVFIDEIDKIVDKGHASGPSREGVQRDLLPLIEGSTVFTKYGMIKTDHILFIASGAFHLAKPSDLIPELQGRLPIRVEFHPLTANDFIRILTEPRASLTEQYIALMQVEGVDLVFSEDGISKIAEIAYRVNESTENIGARRLQTVLARLMEEISFSAPELKVKRENNIVVDAAYVTERLAHLAQDDDLSRSIL